MSEHTPKTFMEQYMKAQLGRAFQYRLCHLARQLWHIDALREQYVKDVNDVDGQLTRLRTKASQNRPSQPNEEHKVWLEDMYAFLATLKEFEGMLETLQIAQKQLEAQFSEAALTAMRAKESKALAALEEMCRTESDRDAHVDFLRREILSYFLTKAVEESGGINSRPGRERRHQIIYREPQENPVRWPDIIAEELDDHLLKVKVFVGNTMDKANRLRVIRRAAAELGLPLKRVKRGPKSAGKRHRS